MIKALIVRFRQKHRTGRFPDEAPVLPDRFRGLPVLDASMDADACREAVSACPVDALAPAGGRLSLDMGKCIFCGACAAEGAGGISFSADYRLAARDRAGLEVTAGGKPAGDVFAPDIAALFGRSLKLRQVSAGGCNACEADVNVLNTLVFDLGRFGIQFVASPRHADGLLITGPVTENMRTALLKTYEAVPDPKIVIAVGACAISGGIYAGRPEAHNGADSLLPVDLYIPGCPPHPYTILQGLVGLLRKRSFPVR